MLANYIHDLVQKGRGVTGIQSRISVLLVRFVSNKNQSFSKKKEKAWGLEFAESSWTDSLIQRLSRKIGI